LVTQIPSARRNIWCCSGGSIKRNGVVVAIVFLNVISLI
jgi:hypothetical protein